MVRKAIRSDIEPVRRTVGYRLAVAVVAVAMLFLPVLYLGLIVAVVALLYWHATTNHTLFRETRLYVAIIVYPAPLLVGLAFLGFLIKPLLARPSRVRRGRAIQSDKERVLAAFVEEIAGAVHARPPSRIVINCEVSASAGFGRGLLSLFGSNLTLTIGLPLVEGMSARQLAGLVAHELGLFAHGAGMRVSFLVRSINDWFRRVVFERDEWDEKLNDWRRESEGLSGIVAVAVQSCVIGTRVVLGVFMLISHGLSCFLLRQMEFDADRSEARLVGARTFEKTFRRLTVLSAAAEEATQIVTDGWLKDRFPDDFAALVVGLADDMGARDRREVFEELEDARTGVFDSHPSFADRLASVQEEDPPGVFDLDLPATALFKDYRRMAPIASMDHYKAMFGPGIRASLRPVRDYLKRHAS
jgi:Zn-dependent protease with chaperone function